MVDFIVVEDERLFGELLVTALDGPELHCAGVARSRAEALTLVRRARPDVAVVDVRLADGEDGLDLAVELRRLDPDLRLVVLTSLLDRRTLQRSAALDVDALLSKDTDLAQVRETLRTPRTGFVVDAALLRRLVLVEAPGIMLTQREQQVLDALATGVDVRGIARELSLSPHTVRGYTKSLLAKLGAHSQLEAVAAAGRLGLLTPPR